jgi:hypoxia up-regulated 1
MKLLTLLICLINIYYSLSNLIGIDLGTEYFKVTLLKPGKWFSMVENLQSKTKTPTAIAFKDEERFFGADALAKRMRFPKQVFTFMHEYLGQRYNSEEINKFIEEFFVSYDMEEDQEHKTYIFKVKFNHDEYKFSTEEVFGMIFRYIKFLSDKYSGGDVRDCVVTVPAFYGYKERTAIIQAADMSKLNLLSMVSENVAGAVQFALDKNFTEPQYYIFYNMGSSHLQASLVSFGPAYKFKDMKLLDIGKRIDVLAEAWEKNLGGNAFNYKIIRKLMEKFDETRKDKPSVKGDYKVAERMLPSALKMKEILSANKDVSMTILGVEGGANLDAKMSRDEFETISSDILNRVYRPIEKILERANITVDQIKQVEILGGSARIPKVQEVLKSKLGNIIGTHMNGDDSMALGAAYICANFSANFKHKRPELYHGANYELRLNIKNNIKTDPENNYCPEFNENQTAFAHDCTRRINKNTTLFKARGGFDIDRKVSFRHDDDLMVEVLERFEDSEEEKLLMTYYISGVKAVIEELENNYITALPKINLRFNLDKKGMLTFKAEVTYEIHLYLTYQTGPTGGSEFIYSPNYTEPLPQEQLDEEIRKLNLTGEASDTFIQMKKDIGKKKTQEVKKDLTVELVYSYPTPLTKEQITESKNKLDSLDRHDSNRIKKMEARNSLETLIYNKKEWLEGEEARIYGKIEELEKARVTVSDIATWFDDEAFSTDTSTLESKTSLLKLDFRDIESRIDRHRKTEKAIEKFHKGINKTHHEAQKLLTDKPWTIIYYNSSVNREFNNTYVWFEDMYTRYSNSPLNEVNYKLTT